MATDGGYNFVTIENLRVRIIKGNLCDQQADVLVCSGPKDLQLSNGGLSKALLRVAGREMQDELNQNYYNGVEYGDIAVSEGHKLQCKFVYHGALPKWGTSQPDPCSTLEKFMMKCLETANIHCRSSIAFPTLGVGFLHYPSDQTAKLMIKAIRDFSSKQSSMNIKTIIIVVYSGSNDWSSVKNVFMNELRRGRGYLGAQVAIARSSVSRHSCSGQVGGIPVRVLVGSIVEERVDVIVNSVAHNLEMTQGAAAAILAAAGHGLETELSQNYPNGINHGDIAVSDGHNLKCDKVYHGVLLPWYSKRSEYSKLPHEVLEDFVFACLQMANIHGYSSVAIPALGTGFHKFPIDVAVACIASGIEKFSNQGQQHNITDLRIVLYEGNSDLPVLESAFQNKIKRRKSSASVGFRNIQTVPRRGTMEYLEYKYKETLRTPSYWTKFTSTQELKDWNLQDKSKSFHLENVDQITYDSIANALKKSLPNAKDISIQRLENAELFLNYGEECHRLFRKAKKENFPTLDKIPSFLSPVQIMHALDPSMTKEIHSEINEYYFFHGTKAVNVDVICGQGLDSRLAASGRLGPGIYGAEVASKSHKYAECNSRNYFPMFLVRMCLGDIYLTDTEEKYVRPPCKKCNNSVCTVHQEIHDSVVANGGDFVDCEFVVYDRHQSYPEYLIWYSR
ncbi:protein mono-ADP-ribosyltransferase PARP15-like [Saccostrea echinata]|uniref:protein mono-ADP-ribosyltransferase PARP15-like n=1 Tax=Saccostrea echinata TaxID=191078 RepID=UPI002A818A14|nr:protein mono-ADP-ribosyltransferase PARP15-like [Saccostrea echinata]